MPRLVMRRNEVVGWRIGRVVGCGSQPSVSPPSLTQYVDFSLWLRGFEYRIVWLPVLLFSGPRRWKTSVRSALARRALATRAPPSTVLSPTS